MSSSNQNIIPKDCSYQCGTRIYWSVADNAYLEVFSKQKHICKNRPNNNNNVSKSSTTYIPNQLIITNFQNNLNPKQVIR